MDTEKTLDNESSLSFGKTETEKKEEFEEGHDQTCQKQQQEEHVQRINPNSVPMTKLESDDDIEKEINKVFKSYSIQKQYRDERPAENRMKLHGNDSRDPNIKMKGSKLMQDRNAHFAYMMDLRKQNPSKQQMEHLTTYYKEKDRYIVPQGQQYMIVSTFGSEGTSSVKIEKEGIHGLKVWRSCETFEQAMSELRDMYKTNPYMYMMGPQIIDLKASKGMIWLPPVFNDATEFKALNEEYEGFMSKHLKSKFLDFVQVESRKDHAVQQSHEVNAISKGYDRFLKIALQDHLEMDDKQMAECMSQCMSQFDLYTPPNDKGGEENSSSYISRPNDETLESSMKQAMSVHPKIVPRFIETKRATDDVYMGSSGNKNVRHRYLKYYNDGDMGWYIVVIREVKDEEKSEGKDWVQVAEDVVCKVDFSNTMYSTSVLSNLKAPGSDNVKSKDIEDKQDEVTTILSNISTRKIIDEPQIKQEPIQDADLIPDLEDEKRDYVDSRYNFYSPIKKRNPAEGSGVGEYMKIRSSNRTDAKKTVAKKAAMKKAVSMEEYMKMSIDEQKNSFIQEYIDLGYNNTTNKSNPPSIDKDNTRIHPSKSSGHKQRDDLSNNQSPHEHDKSGHREDRHLFKSESRVGKSFEILDEVISAYNKYPWFKNVLQNQ